LTKIEDFQDKIKKKSKYELIKSLLQAFTITVVSVVVVIAFIPKSPLASFDQVKAFSHEVIYQVQISDEDNVVQDDILKIVLENQFHKYEQNITIGQNFGSFKDLEKNTQYQLKVVYDKGFGEEVLAKTLVTTTNDLVAAISDINLIELQEYLVTYELNLIYGDLTGYQNLQIRYGTDFGGEYPISYNSISLLSYPASMTIEFQGYSASEFVIILEGTFEGNQVIIDEYRIKKPFKVSAFMYLEFYNDREVAFGLFGDVDHEHEIRYLMEVYQNNTLVRTIEYDLHEESYHSHDSYYIIDKLKPETEYHFVFKAKYQNPESLRMEELIIGEETITTLSALVYEIDVIENEFNYQVTITVNQELFDIAYYDYYYLETDYYYYYKGDSYYFVEEQGVYTVTFIIDKETFADFYINIALESTGNYNYRINIKRIES